MMADDDGSAQKSIDKAALQMLQETQEKGVETIWDRYQASSLSSGSSEP